MSIIHLRFSVTDIEFKNIRDLRILFAHKFSIHPFVQQDEISSEPSADSFSSLASEVSDSSERNTASHVSDSEFENEGNSVLSCSSLKSSMEESVSASWTNVLSIDDRTAESGKSSLDHLMDFVGVDMKGSSAI